MRPYSEVVKKTIKKVSSPAPTQIVLGTEHSYKILTCIIHAHMINMARPGSYSRELNNMLKINNLPPVNAPDDVPSEQIFGARMTTNVTQAQSRDSVATGASGFQDEEYEEMELTASLGLRASSMPDIAEAAAGAAASEGPSKLSQSLRSTEVGARSKQHRTYKTLNSNIN